MTAVAAPERDLWWAAQRIAAPDTSDFEARHRRGVVRLPYDLGPRSGGMAGDVVTAWVCCDPACGGVELNRDTLQLNHGCCGHASCACHPAAPQRRHTAGLGTVHFAGSYLGPFTDWWEPS